LESLAQKLGQIRNLDFILVALWISTIIVGIIVIIIVIRKLKRRSSLYVDVATDDQIVQIRILDFSNATRAFAIKGGDVTG
jgi:beta-lactamase regulating signal transducer with metallopeptidase domain